jgi:hypothetical protein
LKSAGRCILCAIMSLPAILPLLTADDARFIGRCSRLVFVPQSLRLSACQRQRSPRYLPRSALSQLRRQTFSLNSSFSGSRIFSPQTRSHLDIACMHPSLPHHQNCSNTAALPSGIDLEDLRLFEGLRYDGSSDADPASLLDTDLAILAGKVEEHISEWAAEMDLRIVVAGLSRDLQRQVMREVWHKIRQDTGGGRDVPVSVCFPASCCLFIFG